MKANLPNANPVRRYFVRAEQQGGSVRDCPQFVSSGPHEPSGNLVRRAVVGGSLWNLMVPGAGIEPALLLREYGF